MTRDTKLLLLYQHRINFVISFLIFLFTFNLFCAVFISLIFVVGCFADNFRHLGSITGFVHFYFSLIHFFVYSFYSSNRSHRVLNIKWLNDKKYKYFNNNNNVDG